MTDHRSDAGPAPAQSRGAAPVAAADIPPADGAPAALARAVPAFGDVRHWVFDLDNTLYPREARLFALIEVRMANWVMQALGLERAGADALRADYCRRYGTTLAGLMREHGVDPGPYLTDVHEIPLDALTPDATLAARDPRRCRGARSSIPTAPGAMPNGYCAARGPGGHVRRLCTGSRMPVSCPSPRQRPSTPCSARRRSIPAPAPCSRTRRRTFWCRMGWAWSPSMSPRRGGRVTISTITRPDLTGFLHGLDR